MDPLVVVDYDVKLPSGRGMAKVYQAAAVGVQG
jgi:hypothetical protein